eukprot:scaffold618_cov372-Prasinococcus_capsulatus_cf.AAC.9
MLTWSSPGRAGAHTPDPLAPGARGATAAGRQPVRCAVRGAHLCTCAGPGGCRPILSLDGSVADAACVHVPSLAGVAAHKPARATRLPTDAAPPALRQAAHRYRASSQGANTTASWARAGRSKLNADRLERAGHARVGGAALLAAARKHRRGPRRVARPRAADREWRGSASAGHIHSCGKAAPAPKALRGVTGPRARRAPGSAAPRSRARRLRLQGYEPEHDEPAGVRC